MFRLTITRIEGDGYTGGVGTNGGFAPNGRWPDAWVWVDGLVNTVYTFYRYSKIGNK